MLHEVFALAESQLADREWFLEAFGAADIYFFWCFRRATIFNLDTSALPNCRAHLQRMSARPSVTQFVAFEAKTLQELGRPKLD